MKLRTFTYFRGLRRAALGLLLASAGGAQAQTITSFAYTGSPQTYTVPTGVTRLQVVATGAAGGANNGAAYALGAQVQATVAVTAGEVLTVVVGGQGSSQSNAGGYNGGGNSGSNSNLGYGGGGATDLRRDATIRGRTADYLATRNALLVAAGGGGSGGISGGGNGGTPQGQNGAGQIGGSGASQTSPGANATNGTGGTGGVVGGGGGGGYYGGDGGGSGSSTAGGGGGGSSWATAGATNVSYALAPAAGNGALTIIPLYAGSQQFAYTGSPQTYTVPAGVTRLQVVATGAAGGAASGTAYAYGAQVQATVAVTPGEVLTVVVGGQGGGAREAGGYNGGGSSRFSGSLAQGGGGGGATDLRRDAAAQGRTADYLSTRNALLVAAGGGGSPNVSDRGGNGGTPQGQNGSSSSTMIAIGGGANQASPGAGTIAAQPGTNGTGGDGDGLGGGGGGGYYGGGGGGYGSSPGGGGGGSSWATASASNVSYTLASAAGNGALVITPLYAGPTITSLSPTSGAVGSTLTINGTNLSTATSVRFGELAAPRGSFTVNAAGTQLTVTVTVLAASNAVSVTTPGGVAVSAARFQVTRASSGVAYAGVGDLQLTGGGAITVGAYSAPTVTDLDGNGRLDLLVGNSTGNASGNVVRYEQTNANATTFTSRGTLQAGGAAITVGNLAAPTVTDLDGNGLLDLLVGDISGTVARYEQTSVGAATFTRLGNLQAGGAPITVGNNATPTVSDLDGNGLLDLLVGNNGGTVAHYEQTSAGAATFTSLGTLQAGGVAITVGARSAPTVTDLDGNGLLDLLVGGVSGYLARYEQVSAGATSFVAAAFPLSSTQIGGEAKPVVTDLNGDGLLDLLVGNVYGTVPRFVQALPAPTITAVSPAPNARAAAPTSAVQVTFSKALAASAAGALKVFSAQRGGLRTATTPATVSGNQLSFTPSAYPFRPGEVVSATVTTAAQSSDGGRLAAPRVFQFTTATGGTGRGNFSGTQDVGVGTSPQSVAVGDVDGDGDLDLLTANQSSGTVSVRLNDGTGGFSSAPDVPVGIYPNGLAVGDVDGDGDLDFLTANTGSNNVSVRLNNGTGSFSNAPDVPVGYNPYGVAVGDMDSDGDLDVLTLDNGSGTVSVRLNNGAGSFSNAPDVPVGNVSYALAVGDVDGDGDLDVLTVNSSNNVSVRLNNGTGSFSNAPDVPVGNRPVALAVGDVDGDGDLDLLAANSNSNNVSVRLNNGAGSFSNAPDVPVNTNPYSVTVGDVDGDGDLDFLAANYGNNTVSICLNNGTGSFSNAPDVPVGNRPVALAVGDVDGDGDLDLLTANSGSNNVSVRLNQAPAPTITAVSPAPNARAAAPTSAVQVTFSKALAASAAGALLKVFSAQRGGLRTATTPATVSGSQLSFTPSAYPYKPGETVSATVTTAAQSSDGGRLAAPRVFQFTTATGGTGRGNFSGTQDVGVTGSPQSVAVGDVDGDGDLDLLAADGSNTVSVRLNGGTGTFSGTQNVSVARGPFSVALGDVDGDGDLDLLTANFSSNNVSVRLNDGTGTFSGTQNVAVGNSPFGVAVGDVDGDGDLDVLTANQGSSNVSVRLNDGTGTFGGGSDVSVARGPLAVALGDVDGDGDLDLLTANNNSSSNNVSVRLNDGTGTFSGTQNVGVGRSPLSLAVGDVDGDGDLDFLTANSAGGVSVRLNNGSGTFTGTQTVSVGGIPSSVALGDVDGDGDLDFLTANSTSSVSVRLNQPPAPTISSFTPTSGPVGTQVTITGTNLDGTTLISFSGTSNNTVSTGYTVNSAGTSITGVVVPGGAATGPLSVSTPGGTATSAASFTVTLPVTAAPVLTSPAAGSTTNGLPTFAGTAPAGSTVTIYVTPSGGTTQPLGTTPAPNGSFSFVPATALASGSYAAYATAQSSSSSASANSNTNAFTVDATAPTVTLTTTASSPTSMSPIPFSATFSEAVTGFAASGLSVSNGTVTGNTVSGSGSGPYTFTITPSGSGVVTASVPAGAAQDAVGNASVASNAVSITYAAPVTATTWTGTTSTDWFTAGNWSAGVPTATVDALIPGAPSGGRFPLIIAGAASARNLTLSSGATLTQTGGTLEVRANLTNNGTLTTTTAAGTSGGTVLLGGGATATSILGSGPIRFYNLTIQASGASLAASAGASVRRVLTLTGNLATNANAFTLESAATGTALVVNSGGVVTGTATVQRAIDPSLNSGLGYHHYSAPVSTSTVTDLATPTGFTPVVNPAYNVAAAPANVQPFPTVFGYDDSRLSLTNNLNAFDKGYYSPAALGDPLVVGRGYTVNLGASELVDFQGTLNNGDLSLNLTSTRPSYPDGGWQLLGNPYPAPLDYARVAPTDRAGLEAAIYVLSSTSQYGGYYRTTLTTPAGMTIGNPVLPLGQAFFARVADGLRTATLTFRNSQRLTEPDATAFQRPTAPTQPLVQLTLQGAGQVLADEAYVYFESGATSGFEPAFDAQKLPNPTGLNLSTSLPAGQQLSIDGQPELGPAQRVVPLAVGVPAVGVYSLMASQLLNLSAVSVYLRDRQLGTLTDLRQQPSYQFTVSNASAPLTSRFELVFSPQQPLATVPAVLAQQVALYPNPARTQVTLALPVALGRQPVTAALLDALGRVVRQQELPAGASPHTLLLHGLPPGLYSLRLRTAAGVVVKKLALE